eukprot:5872552-Amphidinium_carterae.3
MHQGRGGRGRPLQGVEGSHGAIRVRQRMFEGMNLLRAALACRALGASRHSGAVCLICPTQRQQTLACA